MFAYIHVDCRKNLSVVCGLTFSNWNSTIFHENYVSLFDIPLKNDAILKQESDCFKKIVRMAKRKLDYIIINKAVWRGDGLPAAGALLYQSFQKTMPVIGIHSQKTAQAIPIFRNGSPKPIYISIAGVDKDIAIDGIKKLSGDKLIPTCEITTRTLANEYHQTQK